LVGPKIKGGWGLRGGKQGGIAGKLKVVRVGKLVFLAIGELGGGPKFNTGVRIFRAKIFFARSGNPIWEKGRAGFRD